MQNTKYLIISIAVLLLPRMINAQNTDLKKELDKIEQEIDSSFLDKFEFDEVYSPIEEDTLDYHFCCFFQETFPEFKGGDPSGFKTYVHKNLEYPQPAIDAGFIGACSYLFHKMNFSKIEQFFPLITS